MDGEVKEAMMAAAVAALRENSAADLAALVTALVTRFDVPPEDAAAAVAEAAQILGLGA